jgi:hypothetical protein
MNRYNIAGLASLGLSTILWIAPVFNNNNLFPETRVCFRPKQILNKENDGLLRCDSNSRVGIILTSVFRNLDKRDIEFSGKVASDSITQHFDSNLQQTKNFQLFSIALALIALGCFSKSEQDRKANRNRAYHGRRKEYVTNEMLVDNYLYPSNPKAIATNKAVAKKELELRFSEQDKSISENELETAKNYKELDKIRNKKQSKKPSTNESREEDKQSLIDALKAWEDGWLWTLINSVKPIFLIGDMGSAKTSMAVSLGLVREALGHRIHRIADKHLNGENSDKWNLLRTELRHDNNSSILEALQEQIERRSERINQRPNDKEQFILDEFTQLAKISKEAKELIPLFVTSTYSDTRKAKELFIGVTHSFTNASFGDGVYELRQRGWLIEKFSVDGEKPIPRVVIKTGLKDKDGNNLEDIEKTLPNWFRPELIHGHLNGSPINFD